MKTLKWLWSNAGPGVFLFVVALPGWEVLTRHADYWWRESNRRDCLLEFECPAGWHTGLDYFDRCECQVDSADKTYPEPTRRRR